MIDQLSDESLTQVASTFCLGAGHSGNIRFHKVVASFRERYSRACRSEKTEIAEEIVRLIQTTEDQNCRPGRFLKRVEEDESWEEVSDMVAREKVSHALRGKPRKEEIDLLILKRENMTPEDVYGHLQGKRQKVGPIHPIHIDGRIVGLDPSFFRMPQDTIFSGSHSIMTRELQNQHTQQLLMAALAETQVYIPRTAGNLVSYGGMGIYGIPGRNFENTDSGIHLSTLVGRSGFAEQHLPLDRQIVRGDPRFWM